MEATEWKLCTFQGPASAISGLLPLCGSCKGFHLRGWKGVGLSAQRRLPLWLLKKECVCLSKQNFPAYLEEGGRPPARKEQGSVWFKREKNSTAQAHQPLPRTAFPSHKDSCSLLHGWPPQQFPTDSVSLSLEAGGADEAIEE